MGKDSKQKAAVIGLVSILLVAMVVAVAVNVSKKDDEEESSSVNTSTKVSHAICSQTDYKETCEKSLEGTDSNDPQELAKAAFHATIKDLKDSVEQSDLFKEAAKDDRTKDALDTCKEVVQASVDDLERSLDRVNNFDMSKFDEYVEDVKVWLSGALAHHEACVDAFQETDGETAEKMRDLLTTSGEMMSNGLAMVQGFSNILSSFGLFRRLLSEPKLMESNMIKTDIVVAQDGSGDFKTITDAIKSLPKKNNDSITIHVKAGTYKENVIVPKKVNNIKLIGDGPTKTRISGSLNFVDGVGTFRTATLAINGDEFMAKDIGIENTAGPHKHQAVAVRVSGDKAIFYNVHMDGYQDTLYSHNYRQFYRDCVISGTIDFIFGDANAVFQNCTLVVRQPMKNQGCMVTAQGRKDKRSTGAVILQNCKIVPDPSFLKMNPRPQVYLGRPWKEYSRTIIMQSFIDDFIAPQGWSPWEGSFALDTLYYGEFENRGPGSDLSKRVTWKGIQKMTPELAESFTPKKASMADDWIKAAKVPYEPAMMKV